MIGSVAIAGFVAFWAFWVLLAYGYWREELGPTTVAVFVGLWLAGFVGARLIPTIGLLFSSYVATLDVALVLAIFRGDIRIT